MHQERRRRNRVLRRQDGVAGTAQAAVVGLGAGLAGDFGKPVHPSTKLRMNGFSLAADFLCLRGGRALLEMGDDVFAHQLDGVHYAGVGQVAGLDEA